jgi:hypothetical protein
MKNPVNLEIVVLWILFIFYGFIIVSFFWRKTREGVTGMETSSNSLGDLSTSSTDAIPNKNTPPISTQSTSNSSGSTDDKIAELKKQINDLYNSLKSKIDDLNSKADGLKTNINTTASSPTKASSSEAISIATPSSSST